MDAQVIYSFILCLVLLLWVYTRFASKTAAFPPGPRPRLVVGNIFDMPTTQIWKTFHSWKAQYGLWCPIDLFLLLTTEQLQPGDIVYFRAFRTSYRACSFCLCSYCLKFNSYSQHPRVRDRIARKTWLDLFASANAHYAWAAHGSQQSRRSYHLSC